MTQICKACKDKLIEEHRSINVGHDWWDCTIEDFVRDMANVGVTTETKLVCFSGFSSQGDGASFTGHIHDIDKFISSHPETFKPAVYPMVRKLLKDGGGVHFSIARKSHHYCHENTIRADVEHDNFRDVLPYDQSELRDAVIDQWDTMLELELESLIDDVERVVRDQCRQLHSSLNDEYDYLTGDEAVWEAIEANDLQEENECDDCECNIEAQAAVHA